MSSTYLVVIKNTNLLYSEIDDEVVILRMSDGKYFRINDIGCEIWKFADGKKSILSIIEWLKEQYEAPAEQIEFEVMAFIKELKSLGFIKLKKSNEHTSL